LEVLPTIDMRQGSEEKPSSQDRLASVAFFAPEDQHGYYSPIFSVTVDAQSSNRRTDDYA
jgi:hypothetical protein